jgi:hypothetical protein
MRNDLTRDAACHEFDMMPSEVPSRDCQRIASYPSWRVLCEAYVQSGCTKGVSLNTKLRVSFRYRLIRMFHLVLLRDLIEDVRGAACSTQEIINMHKIMDGKPERNRLLRRNSCR